MTGDLAADEVATWRARWVAWLHSRRAEGRPRRLAEAAERAADRLGAAVTRDRSRLLAWGLLGVLAGLLLGFALARGH